MWRHCFAVLVWCLLSSPTQAAPVCPEGGFFNPETPLAACTLVWSAQGQEFVLNYSPATETLPMQWVISGAADQTISFGGADFELPPTLADLDQDGWPDLWLYLGTGNVNSSNEVYRYNPTRRQFVSLGVLAGLDVFSTDGYIVKSGRASCCAWEQHYYTLQDDRLIRAFGVYTELGADETDPGSCKVFMLDDNYGFTAGPPLSADDLVELERKYCAE